MECMVAILICVGSMLLLSGAAYVQGRAAGYRKGRYDLDLLMQKAAKSLDDHIEERSGHFRRSSPKNGRPEQPFSKFQGGWE